MLFIELRTKEYFVGYCPVTMYRDRWVLVRFQAFISFIIFFFKFKLKKKQINLIDERSQITFEYNQNSNDTLDSIECLEFNNLDKNICHCKYFTIYLTSLTFS